MMKRFYLTTRQCAGLFFLSILLSCLFTLLNPGKTYAITPTVDNVTTGPIANNQITWQHTVTNNTNGILLVFVEGAGRNASSVTYNGTALNLKTQTATATTSFNWYYMLNPPTGTHPIVVTGNTRLMAGAMSLSNVSQSDPWDHTQPVGSCTAGTGPFCYPSWNPARNTELWIGMFSIDNSDALTINPMAGATNMWVMHSGTVYFFSEYLPGVTGTITPSFTINPSPNGSGYNGNSTMGGLGIQAASQTPPQTYSISGNVFTDSNKNGVKDGSETNNANTPNITISPNAGTITTTASGTYSITNLPQGTYTISYNSLPSGYKITYPLNGPPPSFQVTVGPGCNTNGAQGASCL